MAFEKYVIITNPEDPKMSLHLFRALIGEYIEGQKTKSEILASIEEHLGLSLSGDEASDLQALMVAIDGETKPEQKRNVADDAYRVLIIAEHHGDVSMYDTKAKLRTRLNWI